MVSMLKLFGVFYALVGLFVACKAAISGDESIQLPFGFAYPLWTFYIYVTVHLPHPAAWSTMTVILMCVVFYSITGLISGAAVVLVYNWLARFWPFLSAEPERDSQPKPSETTPDLTPLA
jgi:hypothetical protein